MGAFCVFGVSRQQCRKKAESSVKTVCEQTGRHLTVHEWGQRVREEGDRIFLALERQVRISPEFDAPQFCRDWVRVSPSEVRLAQIMVRGPKTDDSGKPVLRNGSPVMTWVLYEDLSGLLSTSAVVKTEAIAA